MEGERTKTKSVRQTERERERELTSRISNLNRLEMPGTQLKPRSLSSVAQGRVGFASAYKAGGKKAKGLEWCL